MRGDLVRCKGYRLVNLKSFVDFKLVFQKEVVQRTFRISLFPHPDSETFRGKTAMKVQRLPLQRLTRFVLGAVASINWPDTGIVVRVPLKPGTDPINRVNRFLVQFLPMLAIEKES